MVSAKSRKIYDMKNRLHSVWGLFLRKVKAYRLSKSMLWVNCSGCIKSNTWKECKVLGI